MNNTNSIASRVKLRASEKARPGRVGGTEHKKLVMLRKKEVELRKRRRKSSIEC